MKNTLVVYYSHTGSNRYLAGQIAQQLHADIEEIRPWFRWFYFLLFSSSLKLCLGIRPLKQPPKVYKKVILVGPIWMGQLISPLRCFIKKYKKDLHALYYATCCGGHDAMKDDKFGYATVFAKLKDLTGDLPLSCEAFPIGLVVPEEKKHDDQTLMSTRLSDQNFHGEIVVRLQGFLDKVRGT